ncbi:integrase [Candidatus Magnetomorum sp. HK-1]|nr:integrase [Candidatus Magnetomorum sp. HK-1]
MTNDKIPLTTLSLIDDSSILYFFFIISAMKAGKNRRTASKYLEHGQLPSGLAPKNRKWRNRANPFNEHWPEIEQWLKISPELEAKFIFEQLCEKYPETYQEGQVRTLQRHIKQWKAIEGPKTMC